MASTARELAPRLRMPSQAYVDSYIARRGEQLMLPSGSSRLATRIFYALEDQCPPQYYPKLHEVNAGVMKCVRISLLMVCALQVGFSIAILIVVYLTKVQHDKLFQMFTWSFGWLCAFAGSIGFAGVCYDNRAVLLFFYINQLWGLSNVGTFFAMNLQSTERNLAACKMIEAGDDFTQELSKSDCQQMETTSAYFVGTQVALLAQLWISCLLAKSYSEMIQDRENDADDKALVNFVWSRRGETWVQLRRFEDVVQRQFEELRVSLISRQARPVPSAKGDGRH